MSADSRWLALKELFHAAQELPVSERAHFLDEHSPNPDIRQQVERLLAQEESSADSVLLLLPSPKKPGPRLLKGETIGHHVIESKLGEGGMGEVYIATDTRLNRSVVLKFLHPDHPITGDRRARFLREARAASALNHPGIVTIYEIGEWQGEDYIAMEHVEGRTLRDLLRSLQQPLQVNDAIRYAIQIADAMAVAHQHGIIHRDLKPANIMVTSRGLVKILDFGLAKLSEAVSGELGPDGETKTQIFDGGLTKTGIILGSVAYMSPEQAKGLALDARSDIFALGSILYEMLVGKPAFSAPSQAEVLGAILHLDPPAVSLARPEVGPHLDWITSHCLNKDSSRRFQSMAEVRASLEDLLEQSRSAGGGSASTKAPTVATVQSQRSAPYRWIGIGVLTAIVVIGIAFVMNRKPEKPQELTIMPITTEGGINIEPTVSHDGQFLAYVSDRAGDGHLDLWMKRLHGGSEPIRLTTTEDAESEPVFSPDGSQILFRSEEDGGGIYMVPSLGGSPRLVAKGGRRPRYSPDGKGVLYWTGADNLTSTSNCKVWIVDSGFAEKPRQVLPGFAGALYPVWSPAGDEILFIGSQFETPDRATLSWWSTRLDKEKPEMWKVWQKPTRDELIIPAEWTDRQVICIMPGNKIGQVALSRRGRPDGSPVRRVTTGTQTESSPGVTGSSPRRLIFASLAANANLYSVPFSPNQGVALGEPKKLTMDLGVDYARSISADGRILAFTHAKPADFHHQVWTFDLASGKKTEVTRSGPGKRLVEISPDGRQIAFRNGTVSDGKLFAASADGGQVRELCSGCGSSSYRWFADSRRILYVEDSSSPSLWILDTESGSRTFFASIPIDALDITAFSTDNQWMSILRPALVKPQLFVVRLDPASIQNKTMWTEIPRPRLAGFSGVFSPDGNTLYYPDTTDGPRCLWAQRLDPVSKRPIGKPFAAMHFHSESLRLESPKLNLGLVVSAERLCISLEARSGSIWMLEGFQ